LNSLFFVFKFRGQEPKDVQDAALAAIDGPSEKKKKLKTVAGSSNDEATNAISASAQEQNSEVMAQQEDVLSFGASGHWLSSITDEEIELLVGSFHERPSINQAEEPRGDSSQPTDPLCLGHGRYYDELCMALAISASGWGGGGKCVLMYGFM